MGDYFLFNLSLAKYLIGEVVLLKMKKLIAFALIAISGLGLSACVDKSSSSYKDGYEFGEVSYSPNQPPDYLCNDFAFRAFTEGPGGVPASNEGDWIAGCVQGWRDIQSEYTQG